MRRRGGPGPAAATLLVVASVLSGATAYMYCHKRLGTHKVAAKTFLDGGSVAIPEVHDATPAFDLEDADLHAFVTPDAAKAHATIDAAQVVIAPPIDAAKIAPADAAQVAIAPPADAAVLAPKPDAAQIVVAPKPDAGADVVPPPVDKKKEAAALYEKAHAALEDGDPDKALEYADQSLALRRTQKTLLEKARALQRLSRIDDAVKAIDEAIAIDDKSAAAWETRGLVLWSAKRYDEARAAMQKYIDIDPNGRSAESFKRLIEQK